MEPRTLKARNGKTAPVAVTPSTRLMDLDGLCNYLGFTPRYVRRLVAEDRIPVTRLARKLFFDIEEIDRWIKRSTSNPRRGAA